MKSAEIKNGIVTNIILGQMEAHLPVDDTVSIGDLYDGTRFSKALPSVEFQRQTIVNKIDSMEREDICGRGMRELSLYLLERNANGKELVSEKQRSEEQIDLSTHAFYLKLKARDDQIAVLRLQLSALA